LMKEIRLLIKASLLVMILSVPVFAEQDIKEGYDENTEVSVSGTVVEAVRGMKGPIVVMLRHKEKIYNVVTAPPWYLAAKGIAFTPGQELQIKGSKYIGRDGNSYIVAREIGDPLTGTTITLRDSAFRPMWGGRGMHKMMGM